MSLPDYLLPMQGVCHCTELGMTELYRLAEDVLDRAVPGCFVECGVASGGMAGCIGAAMIETGKVRYFHLFDSFRGLPLAGMHDDFQPGIFGKLVDDKLPIEQRLVPSGIGPAISAELVRRNIEQMFNMVQLPWHYHIGWFQHTLPLDAPDLGPIALLHLDGDLYESTLVCLEHLFPQVSPGGLVIVDDYELHGCQQAVMDYFLNNPPHLLPFADYGGRYFIKP